MPLPVPQRWRQRMMTRGSGDPTRLICSALIAWPSRSCAIPSAEGDPYRNRAARRDILEIRHCSLYAPRDFDISPYFAVMKPTIENGFDYKALHRADLPRPTAEPEEEGDAFWKSSHGRLWRASARSRADA